MNVAKLGLAAVAISLLLAAPVTKVLTDLDAQHSRDQQSKLELDSQFKTLKLEVQKKQQENKDLQKQLQAKREEQAKIAAQQAAKPAVAISAVHTLSSGCEQYRGLVAQYNWNVDTAMAIMQAENNSCNPGKNNAGLNSDGSVDYGLFQVNSVHSDLVSGNLSALYDPATNVKVAYAIYSGANKWHSWSTYNSGKYLTYLR